jgi:hypothetical protein
MHVSDTNFVIVESEEFHALEEEEPTIPDRVYSQFVLLDEGIDYYTDAPPHNSSNNEKKLNNVFIPLIVFAATCTCVLYLLKPRR